MCTQEGYSRVTMACPNPSYWGRLFTNEGNPTEVFTRAIDSSFDYILANHEPRDSRPTEITPGKLVWLYEELGHVKSSIPIPLDHLTEFYRSFQIKFVMRQIDDDAGGTIRVPALLRAGWAQLIRICFFKDPDGALNDFDQMIAQWDLIDPVAARVFPSMPRDAAPPSAVAVYATRYSDLLQSFTASTPTSPSSTTSLSSGSVPLISTPPPSLAAAPPASPPPKFVTRLSSPTTPLNADHPTPLSTDAIFEERRRSTAAMFEERRRSPYSFSNADATPPPYPAIESLSTNLSGTRQDTAPSATSSSPQTFPSTAPFRSPLPALESEEDRLAFYGQALDGKRVSNALVRLQIVLTECYMNAVEPSDSPAELDTPWKELLAALSKGKELNVATEEIINKGPLYEAIGVPYETHVCKVSDTTKAQYPELKEVIKACEGPKACLRYSAFQLEHWTNLARFVVQMGPTSRKTLNTLILLRQPIDPVTNRYFPEIPEASVPLEKDPAVQEKLVKIYNDQVRRVWGDEALVTESNGQYQGSDSFKRFARVAYNYVLANAPPTTPSNVMTVLDYHWWCSKVDDDRGKRFAKDIEALDLTVRIWAKWGIPFTRQEVKKGGRLYGLLPCLDFDNWLQYLTIDVVYCPSDASDVLNAAIDRWPVFDPLMRVRYWSPRAAHFWPPQASPSSKIQLAAHEAAAEWKVAPSIYGDLLQAQASPVKPTQSQDSAAAERLRELKEQEIKSRKRNNNVITAVRIISAFAGISLN